MTDFFISDVHLYPESINHPGREPLHRFLNKIAEEEPGRLWILGDLFDYWFEYRNLIPSGYTGTICLLRNLMEKGWDTCFLPGNHDWWCGDGLHLASGMKIVKTSPLIETIQGINCLLAHGDGLGTGDKGYRLIKPLLRSPAAVRVFSVIHPTAATWLATRFSTTSKRILRKKIDTVPGYLLEWVEQRKNTGIDLVITGHTHCPSVTDLGGVTHASLGDWISHFTYLTIQGGEIRLNEFKN